MEAQTNNGGATTTPTNYHYSPKRLAAEKFNSCGDQVRKLVMERQQVFIRFEKATKDKNWLKEGTGLESLLKIASMTAPSLSFLQQSGGSEWDPIKVKDKMKAFQELVEDSCNSFIMSPIGPLYQCVEVAGQEWCELVENILSPHLLTYIVDNIHDKEVLERIIKEFKSSMNLENELVDPCKIEIVVSSYTASKYVPSRMSKKLEAFPFFSEKLLSVLRFKEGPSRIEVLKKFVGKTLEGENSFLFETEHEAFIFMSARGSLPDVFPAKSFAYSRDGYQIFPFPEFKTVALRIPPTASFLRVYKGDQINFLKRKETELKGKLRHYDKLIFDAREEQLKALKDYQSFDCNQNTISVESQASEQIKSIVDDDEPATKL